MQTSPRPVSAIRKIVLHVNVGPEAQGGAQALANYLRTQDAGYHEIIDNRTYVQCARPDQKVEGASGMNWAGYHVCLIGNLQTPQQWSDPYSTSELTLAALRVASRCHDFGLPPIHLNDTQVADPNARGICDHWAVNRAIVIPANAHGDHSMGPGDHTDVGAGFPWPTFMAQTVKYYSPAVAPQKIIEGTVKMLYVGHRDWLGRYHGKQVKGGAPVYGYAPGKHFFAQGLLARLPNRSLYVRLSDKAHVG